ncbi:MAG: thiosulfate sulfurtransferase GlpE, partial [Gammaproteobacteria bacterium]|nr:thiosulfate sulfurtransferase GlpE [Gammaproteobacteria bacterium]
RQVEALLPRLSALGGPLAGLLLLCLLLIYIGYRWRERRRFQRALQMARINVAELEAHLRSPTPPVVIDVRLASAHGPRPQRIPGALHVPLQQIPQHAAHLPRDRDVVLYCACPNEASAAQAAKLLMRHGLMRARPLRGGLDAWVAAGYPVEPLPNPALPDRPAVAPAPSLGL